MLPVKMNNDLLSALCRTCAETQQQTTCTQSNEDSEFIGACVTDEVKEAVERGYTILDI